MTASAPFYLLENAILLCREGHPELPKRLSCMPEKDVSHCRKVCSEAQESPFGIAKKPIPQHRSCIIKA